MRFASYLSLITLSGCSLLDPFGDSESNNIDFSTAQGTYTPGDTATLQLRNDTAGRLGYNLCLAQLVRFNGGGWLSVDVDGAFSNPCHDILYVLGSNESATYGWTLPANLASGTYRFETEIELMDEEERRQWVPSNAFLVGR